MSMEINGTHNRTQTDYAEQRRAQQALREEKAEEAEKAKEEKEKASEQANNPKDEYISSEKSGEKPSGLYRMEQDENGNKKIVFDDPKKAQNETPAKDKEQPKVKSDNPAEPSQQCTTDTGNVDREIEKLKAKKQQIAQQIQSARGDDAKVRELQKKLAQVENELSQKDNDTYRRQNASVTG